MSAKPKRQRLTRAWDSPFYQAFLLAKHRAMGDAHAEHEIRIWEQKLINAEGMEGRKYGHG